MTDAEKNRQLRARSLNASACRKGMPRPLALLRPCWTAFLRILRCQHCPSDGGKSCRHVGISAAISCFTVLTCTVTLAQEFPPDVDRGRMVYEQHCQACHGAGGWGDGPKADSLRVPPTNFHRPSSLIKSDEEMLRIIEHGVVFSAMHAWQGTLTEGQIQDVLSYIRLLSRQAR